MTEFSSSVVTIETGMSVSKRKQLEYNRVKKQRRRLKLKLANIVDVSEIIPIKTLNDFANAPIKAKRAKISHVSSIDLSIPTASVHHTQTTHTLHRLITPCRETESAAHVQILSHKLNRVNIWCADIVIDPHILDVATRHAILYQATIAQPIQGIDSGVVKQHTGQTLYWQLI